MAQGRLFEDFHGDVCIKHTYTYCLPFHTHQLRSNPMHSTWASSIFKLLLFYKLSFIRWLARKRQYVEVSSVSSYGNSHPGDDNIIEEPSEKSNGHKEENVGAHEESDDVLRHQKYLTSSQLLCLQLRDPSLRCQVLTQILIVFSYLIHKKEIDAEKREQLVAMSQRVEDCLHLIPPSGQEQLQLLLNLFGKSESFWRKWKEDKCKSFETYDAASLPAIKSKPGAGEKRKRRMSGGDRNIYEELRWRGNLDSLPRDTANLWQKKEDFFADYVDACDPENDIEADYHPKNDPLFSWRALRVLSVDNLDLFNLVDTKTGDFERVVREVWKKEMNIIIPGEVLCASTAEEQPPIYGAEEDSGKMSTDEVEGSNNEHEVSPQTHPGAEVDDGVDMVVAYIFDDKPNITDTSNSEVDSNEVMGECSYNTCKIEKVDQDLDEVERDYTCGVDVTLTETPSSSLKAPDKPGETLKHEDSEAGDEVEEGEIELGKREEEIPKQEKEPLDKDQANHAESNVTKKKESSHQNESPRKHQSHRSESNNSNKRETCQRGGGQKSESSNYASRRHDFHYKNPSSGGSRGAIRGNRGHETGGGRAPYRDNYGSKRPGGGPPHGSNLGRGVNDPSARARSQGGGRR